MKRIGLALVVGFLTVLGGWVEAQVYQQLPEQSLHELRYIVVQHKGRLKPLDSFAWESLDRITDSPRYGKQDPVATLLHMAASPEYWSQVPLIAVPYKPLREDLGMESDQDRISVADIQMSGKLNALIPPIVRKQEVDEELTIRENEILDVFNRLAIASDILNHQWHLIPPAEEHLVEWYPISSPQGHPPELLQGISESWNRLITATRDNDAGAQVESVRRLRILLREAGARKYPPDWRIEWEVRYNQWRPFVLSQILYAAAALLLLMSVMRSSSRWYVWGFYLFGMGFAAHTLGILLRVILGGRPPVSNFYETMLWIPYVMVVMAFIMEARHRSRYLAFVGAALAALILFLADQVPLDSSIAPVVAVLRSNKWLTIHVLTIVASYSAIALAAGTAHVYGIVHWLKKDKQVLNNLSLWIYRCLQVGVVLLAAGIMLGAVWANASWGRYWAWDPKETWALITLLWYLAILHGRFAGWLRGFGVAMSTIIGFFFLLVTYYGVSFYMVGLHSYAGGNAKPLPPLLIGYLVFELIYLLFMFTVGRRKA